MSTDRAGAPQPVPDRTARRRTPQKAAIRDALAGSDAFVSAQELHRRLTEAGTSVGLATVYRNLAELAERGEADVLQAEPGVQLYRACGPRHHHHLSCTQCGRTIEIDVPVEGWVDAVAEEHGFVRVRHVVDVFGICADCQASAVNTSA